MHTQSQRQSIEGVNPRCFLDMSAATDAAADYTIKIKYAKTSGVSRKQITDIAFAFLDAALPADPKFNEAVFARAKSLALMQNLVSA